MLPNRRVSVGSSKIIFSQLSGTFNCNAICVSAVAARPLMQIPASLRLQAMRCLARQLRQSPQAVLIDMTDLFNRTALHGSKSQA